MQFYVIRMTVLEMLHQLEQDVLTLLSVAMAPANTEYAISVALFANNICRNTTTARHGSLTIVWRNNQKASYTHTHPSLFDRFPVKGFCSLMHKWLITTPSLRWFSTTTFKWPGIFAAEISSEYISWPNQHQVQHNLFADVT